jgi:hypothetical protein
MFLRCGTRLAKLAILSSLPLVILLAVLAINLIMTGLALYYALGAFFGILWDWINGRLYRPRSEGENLAG